MKIIFFLVLTIFLSLSLNAQIVLDSVDFVQTVGQTWFVQCGDWITVDVGNHGGPHTWDFTSLPTLNDTDLHMIIEPSTAPAFDSFPTANVVELALSDSDSSLMYINLTSSIYTMLGMEEIENGHHFIIEIDSGSVPLPLHYQDSCRISTFDTVFNSGDSVVTVFSSIDQLVDAYGTIIIPLGSYPCLRLRSDNFTIINGYFMTIPVYCDTFVNIQYSWLTENYPELIHIESVEGDTNPNFTTAEYLELYAGFTSGIQENPVENTIVDITIIRQDNIYLLSFRDISDTEMVINDLLGRNIWSEILRGTGSVELSLPYSGIYFLTGKNESSILRKKILIIN